MARTAAGNVPPDRTDSFNLDTFMPYQLAVAATGVSELFAQTYSQEFDITIAEWRVIAHVAHSVNLSVNAVAAFTSLDRVQVSRAVNRLVTKKLLRRRVNPADARLVMLALTAAGRQMHGAIVARGQTIERAIGVRLGEHDRAELQRLLTRVREIVASKAIDRFIAEQNEQSL